MLIIEKFNPDKPYSLIYIDGESNSYFLKRFFIEDTDKKINLFDDQKGAIVYKIFNDWYPMIELSLKDEKKDKELDKEIINVSEFCYIMKYKAKGKRLSKYLVTSINVLEPLPFEEEVEDIEEEEIEEELTLDSNTNNISDEDFIQGELF